MKLIVGLCLVVASVSVSADLDLDSQILKGKEAKDGDYPYNVGLYISEPMSDMLFFSCGGSLISETFVLTAAHCIDKDEAVPEYFEALLGSTYLKKGIGRRGCNKIVHPEFDPEHFYRGNDIGLLEIESISYSDRIKAINLPLFSELNATYEGHIAVVSGWGVTNNSPTLSDILQFTRFLVISNTACAKAIELDEMKGLICAADPDGSGICSGDSGGPLVDMDSKNLIGIASFHPTDDCGTIHFGNAFTRVTSHRQWIYDHTGI